MIRTDRFLYYLLLLMLFMCIVAFLPTSSLDGGYWKVWGSFLVNNGLSAAYDSDINYPPLVLYFLYFWGKLMGGAEQLTAHVHLFKIPILIFDFIGAWAASKVVSHKSQQAFFSFLLLFNLGYLYNTVIWGQTDAMFTTFVLVSLLTAGRKRLILSTLFFVLALNAKPQAMIFLPLWGLWVLPLARQSMRKAGIALMVGVAVQVLLLLPFLAGGNGAKFFSFFSRGYSNPVLSMGAFNLWQLLFGEEVRQISDAGKWGTLSYRQWGLALFFLSSFAALWPAAKAAWRHLKKRTAFSTSSYQQLFLTAGLISLIFYFFNTQMHERYVHPALLMLAAYAFCARDFFPFILISITYFLNLERVMVHFKLSYHTLIFDKNFIAILYLIIIGWCFWRLYRKVN